MAEARVHDLKCIPPYFADVLEGRKRFEVRLNDRRYTVGDILRLREWSVGGGYTGRETRQRVTYILTGSLAHMAAGNVAMSIEPAAAAPAPAPTAPAQPAPTVAGHPDRRTLAHIAYEAMQRWLDRQPPAGSPYGDTVRVRHGLDELGGNAHDLWGTVGEAVAAAVRQEAPSTPAHPVPSEATAEDQLRRKAQDARALAAMGGEREALHLARAAAFAEAAAIVAQSAQPTPDEASRYMPAWPGGSAPPAQPATDEATPRPGESRDAFLARAGDYWDAHDAITGETLQPAPDDVRSWTANDWLRAAREGRLATLPWTTEELELAASASSDPAPPPALNEATVEALAEALWESDAAAYGGWLADDGPQWREDSRIDRTRYRVMARAALAWSARAYGAEAAALRAALAAVVTASEGRMDGSFATFTRTARQVVDAARAGKAALALTPPAAAAAVERLVEAARLVLAEFDRPKAITDEGQIKPLRATLAPFGGGGEW